jgi:hypothetical protein
LVRTQHLLLGNVEGLHGASQAGFLEAAGSEGIKEGNLASSTVKKA